MLGKGRYIGAYNSEMDAVRTVAPEMRELTDRDNREYAVFITVSGRRTKVAGERVGVGRYLTSRLYRGRVNNVVRLTILQALSNFIPRFLLRRPRKVLVHTHPDTQGYLGNVFSGDPQRWWVFGDTSVPTLLRYESIYLIAPNGNLYKYEGKGTGEARANTLKQLRELPPAETGWPKATVRYLKDAGTGEYYPVDSRSG